MQRDMDLVREIMFKIEAAHTFDVRLPPIEVEGYTKDQVAYHLVLLKEAELIEAIDTTKGRDGGIRPLRLTWQGHEFLEAARDDSRWNEAKGLMQKTGGFVFDVVKSVLEQLMMDAVKSQLRIP